MLFLRSLVVGVLARLLVLSATDEATKELEILVLQQRGDDAEPVDHGR